MIRKFSHDLSIIYLSDRDAVTLLFIKFSQELSELLLCTRTITLDKLQIITNICSNDPFKA